MTWSDDFVTIHHGDCLDVMRGMDADSIDAIVTDPPYGLSFMGRDWDHGVPGEHFWREALRVAKPGAHLVAFGGTRTHHRLMCAIEDAGWEIRDCLGYLYGSGFPKSLNLDKSDAFCACNTNGCSIPYSHANEPDMHSLWSGVHAAAVTRCEGEDPELLTSLQRDTSQQGTREALAQGPGRLDEGIRSGIPPEDERFEQSSMEGRGDVSEASRQLRDGEVRPCARVGEADGEAGRLRDGASASDGTDARTTTDADGVRASSRPRSAEQCADEPRTVADESGSQARGVWPICGGCGKPQIPRGLGTSLKPAWEPIILARKSLAGTVASNVQQYGTGALNIDGCRVECDSRPKREVHALRDDVKYAPNSLAGRVDGSLASSKAVGETSLGRWPADIIHDGSDEVLEVFPQSDGQQADVKGTEPSTPATNVYGEYGRHEFSARNDSGSAARFFYTAKASKAERDDGLFEFEEQDTNKWNAGGIGERRRQAGLGRARNTHPTVKPLDLMRWLVRLVTPPDGVVLDPFCGSGTTLKAARAEGHKSVGIDLELEHCEIAWGRLSQGVLL